ncbi:VOC family protein [Paraconexibacter antarcticus]|uniref:VOC family protein n=1 Tax=Paraconexibacter antarcticus TaxID=2949664 RepID=A0ABY5DLT6_9ACTN|nr:VOC family protein [Paraconexibacter antarcticus]UTI62823.1 VOC family protein [Paraconexibacter antarcticus]
MPGPALAAIDVALDPPVWAALGFAVDEDGTCVVGATTLEVIGAAAEGAPLLPGWTLRGPAAATPDTVDGLPTTWTDAPPAAGAPHPNTARALDHVVLRTPDTGRTFAALQATGMELRRERTAGTGSRALRQGFFRHGEAIVEVVGPLQHAGDGPAALWGLSFLVEDLDAAVALLGEGAGAVRDAVQPGRRIVTVRAEACGGLPLALMDG